MWSASFGGIYNTKGTQVGAGKPTQNFRIYWDGDLQDDLLDGTSRERCPMRIDHWNGTGLDRLVTTDDNWGSHEGWSNNSTKNNPVLSADIFGDWREELIVRQADNSALLVYSTTIPTTHRLYTLMHDPVYRAGVAWQNTAYNQPPHLGFWLGAGADKAPKPDIVLVGKTTSVSSRQTRGPGVIALRDVLVLEDLVSLEGLEASAIAPSGRRLSLTVSKGRVDLVPLSRGAWVLDVRQHGNALLTRTVLRP
jgi:hypothetical protein